MGFLLANAQDLTLALGGGQPGCQAGTVGIAILAEVHQVICHLIADIVVLDGQGAPAVFQSAEPVPQIAAVPCAVIVTGKLAVKMPDIALLLLSTAPVLGHHVDDRRHHILAGGTCHVRNLLLLAGLQQIAISRNVIYQLFLHKGDDIHPDHELGLLITESCDVSFYIYVLS